MEEQSPGIRCPHCGCAHAPPVDGGRKVVYTRKKVGWVLRVHQCRHCKKKFQTQEKVIGVTPV